MFWSPILCTATRLIPYSPQRPLTAAHVNPIYISNPYTPDSPYEYELDIPYVHDPLLSPYTFILPTNVYKSLDAPSPQNLISLKKLPSIDPVLVCMQIDP